MKAMEYIWLLFGFLSLLGGIHAFTQHDTRNALVFFLMVLISAFMFTFRIKLRKKREQQMQNGKEE